MTETSPPAGTEMPSSRRLLVSMLAALFVAAILLVTVVLPAQYGIDPTGVGRGLGLTALSGAGTRTLEITNVIGGNEVIQTIEISDAGDPTPLPNPAVFQQAAGSTRRPPSSWSTRTIRPSTSVFRS